MLRALGGAWRGPLSEGTVKGRVKLTEGRPLDRNAVEQSRAAIDSLYNDAGYYAAEVKTLELPQDNGQIRVVFDVKEGERVAISQVAVDGNKQYTDETVVGHMATKPEGFWWFQKGEYDEDKLDQDLRENCRSGTPTVASSISRSLRTPWFPTRRRARRCCTCRWTRGPGTPSAPSTCRGTAASPPRS